MQTINVPRSAGLVLQATDWFPKDLIFKGKPQWSLIGDEPLPIKVEATADGMLAKVTVNPDDTGQARILIRVPDDTNPDAAPDEAFVDVQVSDR